MQKIRPLSLRTIEVAYFQFITLDERGDALDLVLALLDGLVLLAVLLLRKSVDFLLQLIQFGIQSLVKFF